MLDRIDCGLREHGRSLNGLYVAHGSVLHHDCRQDHCALLMKSKRLRGINGRGATHELATGDTLRNWNAEGRQWCARQQNFIHVGGVR